MPLYSFDYLYKYEDLIELINYIQKKYKLKYKETIDFPSILSINIFGFSAGLPNIKKIIFEGRRDMKKIKTCDSCNFPIEDDDLKILQGSNNLLVCKNCNSEFK